MALANSDVQNLRKTHSTIFKWNEYRFQLYQSIYTFGAQSWTYFQAYNQVHEWGIAKVWAGPGQELVVATVNLRSENDFKRFPYVALDTDEYRRCHIVPFCILRNTVL